MDYDAAACCDAVKDYSAEVEDGVAEPLRYTPCACIDSHWRVTLCVWRWWRKANRNHRMYLLRGERACVAVSVLEVRHWLQFLSDAMVGWGTIEWLS